jgi:hypothetical protein
VTRIRQFMRRQYVLVAMLILGLAITAMIALADAGNPVLGTIKGTAVDNGDGTVTIYVRGEWNWLSHNKDCNIDRAGTGVGVIWNDPTEPGYTVTKNAISAGVGVASLAPRDNPSNPAYATVANHNTIDQMVHPVDRGNIPQGLPGKPGQAFVDPSPPGVTQTQVNAWRGGCGREPVFATASITSATNSGNVVTLNTAVAHGFSVGDKITVAGVTPTGYNGSFTIASVPSSTSLTYTGKSGLAPGSGGTVTDTTTTTGAGCVQFCGDPWGSWGYEKNGGRGYAHTYLKCQLPSKVCVNFYDVHGSNAGFNPPNGTKEITVNGNGDNSIQTNSFNVNDGANCIAFFFPSIATDATSGLPSGSIHDKATLSGGPASGYGGTLNFRTYSSLTACNNDTAGSGGTNRGNKTVTGNGDYTSDDLPTPVTPGTYFWRVFYSGDSGNSVQPAVSDCNDNATHPTEKSTVTRPPTTTETAQKVSITDFARVTGLTGLALGGSVKFALFDNLADCNAYNPATNTPTPLAGTPITRTLSGGTSGSETVNSGAVTVTANGTYYWNVSYSGDTFNQASNSTCTEQTTVSGNVSGVDP